MVFNDTTTLQGIVQDAYFEVDADSNIYPIADLTRHANTALDNVVTMILGSDGSWEFDSTNATDIPIGTTALVSGQKDYSYDVEYLVIKSMECSDANGHWVKLKPISTYNEEMALSEFATTGGVPVYYDPIGSSVLLYPTPNYSIDTDDIPSGGLRAYFQRKIDYFTATDTTKEPGFAKHLHKYIPLYCAYSYACAKDLPKQNSLQKRLEYYEGNKLRGGSDAGAIAQFYAYREQDDELVITSEEINAI